MTELSSLMYQLKRSDQKITQLFEERLGISLTRYEILSQLLKQAPCTQIALQDSLQIDQAAITRHLRILEQSAYIERKRNPKNQRQVIVYVTDKAIQEIQVNPSQEHKKVKQQMQQILSDSEVQNLSILLDKLVTGLENINF
ncbi:MarR family winged helix-turn-helix transcriptional regulator [Streptococcus orisratti]|uniref:MarR family winged helix-turn-helix transcriptional regulator n=1 Tax=Streptococcus TaxID=1301 RepID=UPI0003723834|nr:MarR family transcriptional regulator [Streptococcus orisratti]MDY4002731.1 MarR family transcriptional regulator [Streptococcus orisratti]MDY5635904.1 MarR family transcriptional regulator [Streptococcus orisratti]